MPAKSTRTFQCLRPMFDMIGIIDYRFAICDLRFFPHSAFCILHFCILHSSCVRQAPHPPGRSFGFLGGHEKITVRILGDHLERFAGMLGQDTVKNIARPQDFPGPGC